VQPKTLPRADGARDSDLEKLAPPPPNRLIQPAQPQPPASPRGTDDREKQQPAQQTEPAGIPKFPEIAKEPPKQQPSLESVPKLKETPPPSEAQLRLPEIAPPSRGTDSILREMAKQHAEGGGKGQGGGMVVPPDPNNPNFNLPGPQILSDTMGVDFDPYLLRVYLIVRRNWDSVIPQIAQLGRKGRVILQFSIRKDGSVPDLNLMSGSGTPSMDSAALSSIRLSNPFPPLPPEFPGNDILLRFGYYYNMEPEY
jgi:TonB family protein